MPKAEAENVMENDLKTAVSCSILLSLMMFLFFLEFGTMVLCVVDFLSFTITTQRRSMKWTVPTFLPDLD